MSFATLGMVGFLVIARLISSTASPDFENKIYQCLAEIRSDTLTKVFIDLTTLGSFTVLMIISLICLMSSFILREYRTAFFLLINSAGAFLLPHYLKEIFQRARPDFTQHLVDVISLSFPSGHAFGSTCVY
jgi:undecaprenyl-diphosphatase